ncbi:MAG: hypothetical protein QOF65_521 [Thermoleophilaceae bacterium]|nr:hypothetical protein [Thermoleophilaceae bacterium]
MRPLKASKLIRLAPAIAVVALALPSAAFGQATRTWVSGVGDDANPCSRTAPCKTFPGAISKTAAKGEINVIDPGGFGGVTITKSISIKAEGPTAGVLVSGTNAIVVNAPGANDKVKLYGLDINGLGVNSLNGVKVLQAKTVIVRHSQIYEFQRNGIDFSPSTANAKLEVSDVHIHDNVGNGIFVNPTSTGGGARATIRRTDIEDNGCGVAVSSEGFDSGFNFAVNCGTAGPGAFNVSAQANIFRTAISDSSSVGVFARGGNALARIGADEVTGNQVGLQQLDAGVIKSFGNNSVAGNTTDATPGTPTGPNLPPTKRLPKRGSD